jgi:hypothetical protein
MMLAIVGLMPWLDRRLIILARSGIAANVVPNPATKPTISERCQRGGEQALRVVNAQARAAAEDERACWSTANAIIRVKEVMPHAPEDLPVRTNMDACHGVASTYNPRF